MIILLGFGALLIVIFFFMVFKKIHIMLHGVRVEGTIVDLVEEKNNEGGTLHYPVIEFTTRKGLTIRQTYNIGTGFRSRKIGQKVTVYYSSDDPQQFTISADYSEYLAYPFILIFGIILFLIAVGIIGSG